eukprot:2451703-Amphidinium_carterae.1
MVVNHYQYRLSVHDEAIHTATSRQFNFESASSESPDDLRSLHISGWVEDGNLPIGLPRYDR